MRPLWKTAELMSQHVPVFFYEFRYESELGRLGFGENRDYKGIKGMLMDLSNQFVYVLIYTYFNEPQLQPT